MGTICSRHVRCLTSNLKIPANAETAQVSLIEAGPENERYETLCYRHSTTGQCAPYGVLSFWDGDEALYRLAVADDARLSMPTLGNFAADFEDLH